MSFDAANVAAPERGIMLVVKPAVAYFGLVFGAGFVLGPIRILLLVPRLGERYAELLELPVMMAACFFAARWVCRKMAVPRKAGPRLRMGLLALLLLWGAEFGLVLRLRGMTVAEYLATRDPVSGTAYYLSLVVFALLPWALIGWELRDGRIQSAGKGRAHRSDSTGC